jgi:hypothetical protein
MALPTRITLPPSGRPVGGLLSAARPIGVGEWWRGVTFSSAQCVLPQNVGTCTDGDVTKTFGNLAEEATFDPFQVVLALECSTMGRTALATFAQDSLDVVREYGVGLELLTGAASGNPSLADASQLGSGVPDAETALAMLEQVAAQQMGGRLAFIHASPVLGSALLSASVIWRDGRLWRTVGGNIVVISPAYDGREPGAAAPEAGDPLYLYATGEVYAEVGQRDDLDAVERGQNTSQHITEDAALVIFDPCFNVAIDTGLVYCDVEEPS